MISAEIIKKLPKIDLHCHLSGSIRPETIFDIAVKEGIEVPTDKIEKFKKHVQVDNDCKSLKEYLTKFDFNLMVMQKSEYIERITYELLQDTAKQNVKYIEIRFAPMLHMDQGLTIENAVEAVIKGMRKGQEELDIKANLILICMRHHSPKKSIEIVEKASLYLGKGVVGVDLAGNEHDFEPAIHEEAFKLAKDKGLHRTVHAGETGIPKNIVISVEKLFAERIGHGVYAYQDEKVLEYVKNHKIPLEQCLTSNLQTNAVETFEEHPIKSYLDQGVVVTVNTDNMTVSNTDLNKEYVRLIKHQNFTLKDIKKTFMNSVEVSFMEEEEKSKLKEKMEKEIDSIIKSQR
ncbi:MAG: adenosine deaminase [Bacillota bacterium]|nr:adenosine deaminase [Bacillota bacterium]